MFFGEDGDRFGWWFNFGEAFPRGQLSSLMMMMDVGTGGDWVRAFSGGPVDRFGAPTVEDVDFPKLGLAQAWNDIPSGVLHIVTYAATPSLRGTPSQLRVVNLPDPTASVVICDGELFQSVAFSPGPTRVKGSWLLIDVRDGRNAGSTRAARLWLPGNPTVCYRLRRSPTSCCARSAFTGANL